MRFLAYIALALALTGCISEIFSRSAGFDARPISVQSVSFFNQRTPSRLAKRNWKGDWVFRRDRLELIDEGLRNGKPDLVVVQELMERRDSQSESDIRILKAGVLADYEWRQHEVGKFDDTRESESMAIAAALPLRFFALPGDDEGETREFFKLGKDGYLMLSTIDYEEQPLTVLNVQLPRGEDEGSWFSFIQERTLNRLERFHHCPKRLIVAGYLPGDVTARSYKDFIDTLQLRDSATGFCQIESRCFTATPINELFMATVGDESPTRVDRIFVHRSAFVSTSSRNFETPDPQSRYAREFGLPRLWPTQRFGWMTSVRLPRCAADELL